MVRFSQPHAEEKSAFLSSALRRCIEMTAVDQRDVVVVRISSGGCFVNAQH